MKPTGAAAILWVLVCLGHALVPGCAAGAAQPKPGGGDAHAGSALTGVLLDQQGKPVVGEAVGLATEPDGFVVDLVDKGQAGMTYATTGPGGRFSLPRPKAPATLLVAARDGYALRATGTGETPVTLRLRPWGRIDGTLKVGERAGREGAEIGADYSPTEADGLTVHFLAHANAIKGGKFTFDRLFAGEYLLTRHQDGADSRSFKATVRAGEATPVVLAATGRPVRATLGLPDGLERRAGFVFETESLESPLLLTPVKFPSDPLKMTAAERFASFTTWAATPAGRRLVAHRDGAHDLPRVCDEGGQIDEKGKMRWNTGIHLLDVPAGTYHLSVRCHIVDVGGDIGHQNEVAAYAYRLTVPPIAGGASDEVLDLGVLTPEPYGTLDRGQAAPDFVYAAIDGSHHLLSEHRGKVVLLDFWGTWCGNCIVEMPALNAIQTRFGGNPNFKLISLSLDDEPDKLSEFIRERHMTWDQGILGPRDGENAWPVTLYGVPCYPTYVLIDRNGNLAFYGHNDRGLEDAVAKAMGANQDRHPGEDPVGGPGQRQGQK